MFETYIIPAILFVCGYFLFRIVLQGFRLVLGLLFLLTSASAWMFFASSFTDTSAGDVMSLADSYLKKAQEVTQDFISCPPLLCGDQKK